jgi:selenocysteine-specific elongation factor
MVDVELDLLPSSPRGLKNRAKARFHSGTAEIISTVLLLDRDDLEKGDKCYAQIRLDEPTTVLPGDHFILRSYSPVRTIGGGKILNALPLKKKRFAKSAIDELAILNSGDLQERIEEFTRMGRFNGREANELQFLTNSSKTRLDEALKELLAKKKTVQYYKDSASFIHSEYLQRATDEIVSTLNKFHRDFPLKAGLVKEELRSRTEGSRNQRLFNFIISQLIREDTVVQEKELNNRLSEKAGAEVFEVMVKEGILIKVKEDLYFHRDTMLDLKNRLIAFLKKNGEISTPRFKEMTGVSRKYTIPIIEYFDRTQLTVRVGDNRVLRKQ